MGLEDKVREVTALVEGIGFCNGGGLINRAPHYMLYPDDYRKLLTKTRDLEVHVLHLCQLIDEANKKHE